MDLEKLNSFSHLFFIYISVDNNPTRPSDVAPGLMRKTQFFVADYVLTLASIKGQIWLVSWSDMAGELKIDRNGRVNGR